MNSLLLSPEDDREPARLTMQALWFLTHSLIALAAWGGIMFLGSVLQPPAVSHGMIILATLIASFVVGHIVCRIRPDEMASLTWLLGLIWFLLMCLYVLDLPTGPNACYQCQASEKLARTFFSFPSPSGLMDDDAPFLATWPAFATVGYSIGARLAMRRK